MPGRFTMSFSNGGYIPSQNRGPVPSSKATYTYTSTPQKNQALNSPMIARVYKARPGCSACGKKVA